MPGLISSLPGAAGLPPFIFFPTSYSELDSRVAAMAMMGCREQYTGNRTPIG
jgi:hypothetical protein